MNITSNNQSWFSAICSTLKEGVRYAAPALSIGTRVAAIALPFLILCYIPAAAADSETNLCAVESAASGQEAAVAFPLLIPGVLNTTAMLGFLAQQREQWNKTRNSMLDLLPTIREKTDFNEILSGSILIVSRKTDLTSLVVAMGQTYLDPENE